MKKVIFSLVGMMLILVCVVHIKDRQNESHKEISNLKKSHKEFLSNSPFNETLELSKQERKQNGLPPNKYFEEQWELTMNPALGRPEPEKLFQLQKQRKSSKVFAKVPGENDNNWVERGPNNVGGRTRAVMFDPNDDTNSRVFAGGVSGGLWLNENISSSSSVWTEVGIPKNLAISCITYDPNDTMTFYVGTGESYVGGDVNGNGVWKSTDGGASWFNVFGGVTGETNIIPGSTEGRDFDTRVLVNTPGSIAGNYFGLRASFGTSITPISGNLVLADDGSSNGNEACSTLINAAEIAGNIAVLYRGNCEFGRKVLNAENAGAIAVIVINNVADDIIPMGSGEDGDAVTIPSLMLSMADGETLVNELNNGVNVSINGYVNYSGYTAKPGVQHINDIKVRDIGGGNSEVYVAAGSTFYSNASPSTLLGPEDFGLYKSSDAGTNWSKITLLPSSNENDYQLQPNDIEIGIDNTIWLSTTNDMFGNGGGEILSSVDGISFSLKYKVPSGMRTQIEVSNTDSSTLYVLAELSSDNSPVKILATDDAFNTVSELALPNDADAGIPANDFTRTQAFYNLLLSVDPVDDNVIYVGGIDLFKSLDGGVNWDQISKWTEGQDGNPIQDLNVPLVHADQHGIAYGKDDNDRILFVNDGGVYFSSNAGSSITSRNSGFVTTQFYSIGVGPFSVFGSDFFMGGTQDNGTQILQQANVNGTDESIQVVGGDGGYSFFDQDGEDAYFVGNVFYNNLIFLFDFFTEEFVIINDEDEENGSFITPQVLDSNLDILYSNYSADGNFIIKKYSGIKSESTLTKEDLIDPLLNSTPTAFAVSPYTVSSTKLYVGTRFGDLLRVDNANAESQNWTDISGASFVGSVSDVELGKDEDHIFLTMYNYGVNNIWFTKDGGSTWQPKDGDLPDLPVRSILQNPLNYEEVIVGTDLGVWFTTNFSDASPSWSQAFNGMKDVIVTDMDLRDDNAVFAATYGRGIFSGSFSIDPDGDIDGDGVLNDVDNCPQVANADQADVDNNGIGDVCQDLDNDTILDINDNCQENSNIDQVDSDSNGIGDVCQDTDNDGVIDIEDNCPNTANANQNDTNGNGTGDVCDTSYLNPDNISVEIISETCEGLDNGKIIITTKESYLAYTATVIGASLNLSQGFTNGSYTFENIAVGSYIVCVSVDDKMFEQCFEINIDAAEVLDVVFQTSFNSNDVNNGDFTSITINRGTPPFNVTFNGEQIATTSQFTFELEGLENGILEISTAKQCEGIAKKEISSKSMNTVVASPNPVIDYLKVNFPSTHEDEVNIQIYNLGGKLLFNELMNKGKANFIELPFYKFPRGIYFVKVSSKNPETIKIIKK